MRLVCDLDGVVFDFDRAWTSRWAAESGIVIPPNSPQKWGEVHLMAGMAEAEFWDWYLRSGAWLDMPLYPGAREALWWVQARGWEIVYATNRPEPDDWTPKALAEAELPQAGNLTWTKAKWELEGDLFLEDAPHNLEGLWAAGRFTVRVERPWNRPEDYPFVAGRPSIPNLTIAHLRSQVWTAEAIDQLARHTVRPRG